MLQDDQAEDEIKKLAGKQRQIGLRIQLQFHIVRLAMIGPSDLEHLG